MIVKAIPEKQECVFDKYDEPRLHMEHLFKTKLVIFDFSLRILLPLETAGIITIGDLVRQDRNSLNKIKQLGKISIDKLEDFLKSLELSFGMK